MTKARCQQVSLETTPYYHCVSRCVRRAFLCGFDPSTGIDFEHRRAWIEERILYLPSIFCIDVCAYAVMSNHYHVVFHVDQKKVESLSTLDIVKRWHQLCKGTLLTQAYERGIGLSQAEQNAVDDLVVEWRERLSDISWFMRNINEWLAREANAEDQCTGRFWEGRFKSQALLDEKALAACMAYVDLNPVRAKMADTPEKSEFTSYRRRAKSAKTAIKAMSNPENINRQAQELFAFAGNPRQKMSKGLPFKLRDYLELVDWTGRQVREGKRGSIQNGAPRLLERLGIGNDNWLQVSCQFESKFKLLAGAKQSLELACERFCLLRRVGISGSRLLS